MKSKVDLVDDQFSKFNCAQTVLSLFADELGMDKKTALKIASGFGGGMTCAETCGAVTGSYMVLGMKYGHSTSDAMEKAKIKLQVQRFNSEFEKIHGSLICKKLTGFDISKQGEANAANEAGVFRTKCPGFIKTACSILEEKIFINF